MHKTQRNTVPVWLLFCCTLPAISLTCFNQAFFFFYPQIIFAQLISNLLHKALSHPLHRGISINRKKKKPTTKSFVNNISSNPGLLLSTGLRNASPSPQRQQALNPVFQIRYEQLCSCCRKWAPLCASFISSGIICLCRCEPLRSEQPKAIFLYN